MPGFRRFGGVGPSAHRALTAANLRPMAEALAPKQLSEQVQAQLMELIGAQFKTLVQSLYQQGSIYQIPFLANIAPVLLRPAEDRTYVFIQNQSGAAQMVLGIGKSPGAAGTVPVDGLIIGANLGFYEPLIKPQQDLWISASANATPGLLLISLPSWGT